jgi:hypothetical protein
MRTLTHCRAPVFCNTNHNQNGTRWSLKQSKGAARFIFEIITGDCAINDKVWTCVGARKLIAIKMQFNY